MKKFENGSIVVVKEVRGTNCLELSGELKIGDKGVVKEYVSYLGGTHWYCVEFKDKTLDLPHAWLELVLEPVKKDGTIKRNIDDELEELFVKQDDNDGVEITIKFDGNEVTIGSNIPIYIDDEKAEVAFPLIEALYKLLEVEV